MSGDLKTLVSKAYDARAQDWESAKQTVQNWLEQECRKLLDGGDRSRLDCSQSRIKDRERALDKLRRKVEEEELAPASRTDVEKHLTDIVGLKVLCKSTRDQLAIYEALRDPVGLGDLRLVEEKDYVSRPKASGYRACHVLLAVPVVNAERVTVEIQIKTRLQDAWGELTHEDLYKPGAAMSPGRFHGSVARAMSALLAEVDLLADDLAAELESTAAEATQDPDTEGTARVRVRTTGPKYALAVDDRGQQGLIPARAVREAAGVTGFISVDEYLPTGRELTVRVQQRDGGLFYLPVDLGEG